MNWGLGVRTAIVCVLFIVLHFTLRPLLGWRAEIHFLVIALLFGAVRMRPGMAAVFGLFLGLVADALALGSFGATALAMTVVAFAASWLKAVFFADNLVLNGFFLFLGTWVFDLIFFLVERRLHGMELILQILVWSSLSSAVTALAGVLALMMLRPLFESRPA